MKFRKKPVVIEAVQWTWDNFNEVMSMVTELEEPFKLGGGKSLKIFTLEGTMLAQPEDWIIKGIKGEFYPCEPQIFKETYEPVEDSQNEN